MALMDTIQKSKVNYTLLFLTTVIFLSLDAVFLYLMKPSFEKLVYSVQGSPIVMNIYATILCYIALIFGIYYFIIRENKSVIDAFLLGLTIYAVYETTTLAILKKWSYKLALVDTLWGGTLFALTTLIVKSIYKLL